MGNLMRVVIDVGSSGDNQGWFRVWINEPNELHVVGVREKVVQNKTQVSGSRTGWMVMAFMKLGHSGKGEPACIACILQWLTQNCKTPQRGEGDGEGGDGEKKIITKEGEDSLFYERGNQGIRTNQPTITTTFS